MSKRDKVVFLLLDLRRVPSTEDTDMLKWLEYYNIEYYIVFTKADKLSNNEKFKQLKEIRKKLVFKNMDSILTDFRSNDYTNENKLKL